MGNRGSQEQQDSEGRCLLVSLCSPPPICSHHVLHFVSHTSSLLFIAGHRPRKVLFQFSGFEHAPVLPLSVLLSLSVFLPFPLVRQAVWGFDYI